MRQIFYLDTEPLFQRACELREFGDNGDLSWREWYNWNAERTGMQSGELQQALAESMGIPIPARYGFGITGIDHETVIVQDLEECNACDLNDPSDAHMILPVTQFREWLYNWGKNPINRVMGTDEASAIWGLSKQRIKVLCEEGKLEARKIGKQWILNRNQANPRVIPQRKWVFTFEGVKGSLTLADDRYYEFEWSGLETQFIKTPAERDEFLKNNERIGRLIEQLAHAEAITD